MCSSPISGSSFTITVPPEPPSLKSAVSAMTFFAFYQAQYESSLSTSFFKYFLFSFNLASFIYAKYKFKKVTKLYI